MRNHGLVLLVLLVLLICGCGPGKDKSDTDGEVEEAPKEAPEDTDDDKSDMTRMIIRNVKKVSYRVSVHKDVEVGQYWQTESEMYGSKNTFRWQVTQVDGDTAIIEFQMTGKSEHSKYDYVTAYKIDLTKKVGEANVTKAWIGRPGTTAREVGVMAKPEASDDAGAPYIETKDENFADLEFAGAKWSGKVISLKGDGWESKSWIADVGWFDGIIKNEVGGMVTVLTAFGRDAKALLKFPKEKEREAAEGKKGEKEEDDHKGKEEGEKEGGKEGTK